MEKSILNLLMLWKKDDMYNAEVEDIERQENEGKLFVIRPSENLGVGRLEKSTKNNGSL